MNFFRGKSEMENWIREADLKEENLFPIDLERAFQVGKAIFELK